MMFEMDDAVWGIGVLVFAAIFTHQFWLWREITAQRKATNAELETVTKDCELHFGLQPLPIGEAPGRILVVVEKRRPQPMHGLVHADSCRAGRGHTGGV